MKKLMLYFLVLAAWCGSTFSEESFFRLIRNRKPLMDVKILTFDESVAFARDEWVRILSELSGTEYDGKGSPRISLGLAGTAGYNDCDKAMVAAGLDREKLGREGFLITKHGKGLLVSSYSGYGVAQGVYFLIKKATGFEFVRPRAGAKPLTEIANAHFRLELPYYEKPFFAIRGQSVSSQEWGKGTPSEEHLNWLMRNGYNTQACNVGSYAMNRRAFARRGMRQALSGHALHFWIPDDLYYETHPEFFPLIDGERLSGSKGAQLALGNAECRAEIVKRMRDYLKQNPFVTQIAFGANDSGTGGTAGWGQDEADRALDDPRDTPGKGSRMSRSYSTRYIRAANMIAEELAKTNPDVKLHVYAYHFNICIRPPFCEVHPNVVVEFAPLYRCYSHAINDPECPRNRMFAEWLRGWAKLTKNIYIRDYYMMPRRGGLSKIPQSLYLMKKEIDFYRSLGILGMVPEVWGDSAGGANVKDGQPYSSWLKDPGAYERFWDNSALDHYALSRLLWNPDTTVEQIVADFCNSYYGAAAKDMTEYWLTLHRNMLRAGHQGEKVPEKELYAYDGWIYYGPWCVAWNWKTSVAKVAKEAFGILDQKEAKEKIVAAATPLLKAEKIARYSGLRELRYRLERDCDMFERWCLSLGFQLDFESMKQYKKVQFISENSWK